MSNEYVATINFIRTPLTIGLTTSLLTGCSMLPSLPTNNAFRTSNVNKAPVKVRHAVSAVNNDVTTLDNPLPLIVNQNTPQTTNKTVTLLAGSKGKLWNDVIKNEEANQLSNAQTNANDALARIEEEKQRWLTAQRNSLNTSLKSAPTYLHYLVSQAELRNLPSKLALLPLIESGYNPRAGKSSGANAPAGLWQIMPVLAKALNLKMNASYDGRYDIVESTNTAYTYLSGLNRKYKDDWALALAAYNAGAPAVDKAIAKNKAQGKPTDFWSLDLPKETMEYVPRFLALVDIIEHSSHYGVELPFVDQVRQLQFIRVRNGAKLDRIAPIASVPLETLKVLNAGLLRDRVDTFTPRDIVLPFLVPATVIKQIEQLPTNYTYTPSLDKPEEPSTSSDGRPMMQNLNQPNQPPLNRPPREHKFEQPSLNRPPRYDVHQNNRFQPQGNTYVVQAGDTLSGLSQAFGIPRVVLARLNNVDTEYLLIEGETLQLPPSVDFNKNNISANRVRKNARRNHQQPNPSQNNSSNNGHYKVQPGDTLLGIARELHTSVKAIASLNGFDTEYLVKIGEVLTVPVTNSPKSVTKRTKRPIIVHRNNHSGKYQVVRGDSLSSVASRFGLTKNQLARANNLAPESYLFIGQKINIPISGSNGNKRINKQSQVSDSMSPKKEFKQTNNIKSYRVQSGDSLTKLAQRYNTNVRSLAKMNGISPLSDLYTDTIIKVPQTQMPPRNVTVEGGQYKVRPGDGLIKLAKKFGISVNELAKINGMSADSNLFLGQTLHIPNH